MHFRDSLSPAGLIKTEQHREGVEEKPGFGARSLGMIPKPVRSCTTLSCPLSPFEPQLSPLYIGGGGNCLSPRAMEKMK